MSKKPAANGLHHLSIKMTDEVFQKLAVIAAEQERPVAHQARMLLKEAIALYDPKE